MSAFDPQWRDISTTSRSTISLYRIHQAISHMFRRRGQESGLSPAQIQTLLFLRYARPGIHTIGGLAARLAVSYATASGIADALERKELVERRPDPTDQRVMVLSLTTMGLAQVEQLEDVVDDIDAAINSMPDDVQQLLEHALKQIVGRLQQEGHVITYEMCWGCHFFRQDAHPQHPGGPHHCAFVDAPLPEPNTYLECPDFVSRVVNDHVVDDHVVDDH